MKIGAILPHCYVFGGIRRYIELGNAFLSRGHEAIIYTPDGISPSWLPFHGILKRFSEIDSESHDVLMTGSPELVHHLSSARARLKIFYIQLENVRGEREIVKSNKFEIMVNSTGLANRVRKLYRREPLDGIGGIDANLFSPAPRGSGQPFRVMCYGRISRPRKGTRFVEKAVANLRKRGLDLALDLFDTLNPGDTDPRIGFKPTFPCRFYMNLPQERMKWMYCASDVFVSAETRAGWSNTAAEAAACGLPIICTRSGTEDFAVDGDSAIVVPSRSVKCISRALELLYGDRELCKRLGEAARRRILDFTWEKLCARMEDQFKRLLDGGQEQRMKGQKQR